jgi:hypothetical protein
MNSDILCAIGSPSGKGKALRVGAKVITTADDGYPRGATNRFESTSQSLGSQSVQIQGS